MIVATGYRFGASSKAATTTIPIVFYVAEDPVRLGLVDEPRSAGRQLTGDGYL